MAKKATTSNRSSGVALAHSEEMRNWGVFLNTIAGNKSQAISVVDIIKDGRVIFTAPQEIVSNFQKLLGDGNTLKKHVVHAVRTAAKARDDASEEKEDESGIKATKVAAPTTPKHIVELFSMSGTQILKKLFSEDFLTSDLRIDLASAVETGIGTTVFPIEGTKARVTQTIGNFEVLGSALTNGIRLSRQSF